MEQQQIELLAGALGSVASLIVFIKWVWPLIKRGYRNIMGHEQIQTRLDEMSVQIGFLVSEMKINNGLSMRDSLIRVEGMVALSLERQRARDQDSDYMAFETNPVGEYTWVNRTYARAVQRMPVELLGSGWINAVAPAHRDRVTESWHNSVAESREFDMKLSFQTPDGDEFPAWVRSYKMATPCGDTIGYIGKITLL